MILGWINVLSLCIKANIVTFYRVRFYWLRCAERSSSCWWKETPTHTHTHIQAHVQRAVFTCLKSCRLTAMDRKFLMVLERWFTKLSSQNVIGSPWGVHRDISVKKWNEKIYINSFLSHFSLYQSFRDEPQELQQMCLVPWKTGGLNQTMLL